MTKDADLRPPSKMPGQVDTDDGGRPVVDDGGRPVIVQPADGPTAPADVDAPPAEPRRRSARKRT